MGMRPIVVDTGSERQELVRRMGAEAFVDFKEVDNPAAKVLEITGGGAHAVFVTGESITPVRSSTVLRITTEINTIGSYTGIPRVHGLHWHQA